jgi:FtsH-binding integral membrane protein
MRRTNLMDPITVSRDRAEVRVNDFVRSVYNWMCIGLAVTGLAAWYIKDFNIQTHMGIFIILAIAVIAIPLSLSGLITRMSSSTATGLFVLYSGLMGAFLSPIFNVYTNTSIANTFFICSGTFLACSIFGWTTKRDLTSFGGFLRMGLIGIIIASIVNIFVRSNAMTMIISYIGVFVFVGLTAYDTQKLKDMAMAQPDGLDGAVIRKGAILGALSLYLDFINLFLMLLRIFGQSRD